MSQPLVLTAVASQQRQVISSEVSCADCRITSSAVAQLGGRLTDPTSIELFGASVAVDSRGNYAVGPTYSPGEVAIYDSAGRFKRTFGRQGQGPGEFRQIVHVKVGPGDTAYVVEPHRFTKIAPGFGEVISVHRLEGFPHDFLVTSSASFVLMSPPSSGLLGQPLNYLTASGETLLAFGASKDESQKPVQTVEAGYRKLARSYDNQVWAAHVLRYQLERWDAASGRLLQTLVRDAEWYPNMPDDGLPNPLRERPEPRVAVLWEEPARKLVWILTLVADESWRPQTLRGGRAGVALQADSLREAGVTLDRIADTVVEVVDLNSHTVLARQRFDAEFQGYAGRGLVYTTRVTDDGDVAVDIVKLTLTGFEPSRR